MASAFAFLATITPEKYTLYPQVSHQPSIPMIEFDAGKQSPAHKLQITARARSCCMDCAARYSWSGANSLGCDVSSSGAGLLRFTSASFLDLCPPLSNLLMSSSTLLLSFTFFAYTYTFTCM